MSRTATRVRLRRSASAREQRLLARYVLNAMALAVLYLMGHGLLSHHAAERIPSLRSAGQPVPYRTVPALLAQVRAHDPLLRLPHARWYLRVRHGHVQIIVVDRASLSGGGSATGARGGQ